MPHADYRCPDCGCVIIDHVFRMTWGAAASAPCCPHHKRDVVMEVIPQIGRMDVGGVKGASFQSFTIHRQVPTKDGLQQVEEQIDSVHKLRQIEKDSEQRYRDGEGEPLRFRGYNQDASNKDVNSFGTEGSIGDRHYDSGRVPTKKKNIDVKRHGTKKPTTKVARGTGRSSLKG